MELCHITLKEQLENEKEKNEIFLHLFKTKMLTSEELNIIF